MSSSTYPLTTSLRVIKELQYVKETAKGVTPDSPLFTAIPVSTFMPNTAVQSIRYIKLGTERVSKVIKNISHYDIFITYTPIAVDQLLESMINLTGSNSRADTYTFLLSQEHNNSGTLTEMYQIARGCTIVSAKITVKERNLISIDTKWMASSITDWSTSHDLITPTFASTLEDDTPWSAIATGHNPLVFVDLDDGELYDIRNFTATINHNTARMQILDQLHTVMINPGILDVSIDLDIVHKDIQISESVKTFSAQEITMRLHADPDTMLAPTLTFSDVYLEQYDESVDASSTKAKIVSYAGQAAAVLISQESVSGTVTASSTHKYNIVALTTVTASSTHKYNIAALTTVLASSIHKYNIKTLALASSIHKYNIAGLTLGNFDDDNFVGANFVIDT